MTYNGTNEQHGWQQSRVAISAIAPQVAAADPCSAGAPHGRLSVGVRRLKGGPVERNR